VRDRLDVFLIVLASVVACVVALQLAGVRLDFGLSLSSGGQQAVIQEGAREQATMQGRRSRRVQGGVPDTGPCEFPSCFPDATNTGIPSGTTLTTYSGPNPVTADDTVIDAKKILGGLEIRAENVTIRNSYISAENSEGLYCADNIAACADGQPTIIEDSTLDCTGDGASGIVGRASAAAEANMHFIRVDISGCENGLSFADDLTIEDSYIHDLYNDPDVPLPDGAHADGIQFGIGHRDTAGGAEVPGAKDITIQHNTIYAMGWNNAEDTFDYGTAAIISNHAPNLDENVLITQNLLAGGAYTLYCVQSGGAGVNYDVIDNHFSNHFTTNFPYSAGAGAVTSDPDNVGFYGPSDSCANETLSGNVLHETGAPITLD
jgi:hypothetical protein